MPELPVLLFIALGVAAAMWLLHRDYRQRHVPRDRPTMDVQNHEGDE